MKKIVCTILVIMMLISVLEQPQVLAKENEQIYSKSGENMLNYLNGYDDNLLIYRKNYGYMNFVENFESSAISLYFREMSGIFAGIETEPDKQKYMEVLINIISTYDLDNAKDIATQKNMDNLKDMKDYAMDFVEMGKEAISVMSGLSSASGQLEEGISIAISGIAVLAENTNNWLDALSDLETIIHNYVKYDKFLKMIEDNSDGDLKEAAISLRKSMSKAIEIKLETYNNVSDENFENYEEFFFNDIFFNALKQTQEYSTDENFKFFTDCGDNIVSTYGTLKGSWDLGKLIGKLVGNVVVGAEDLINRHLEMVALYNISVILQDEIMDLGNEFLDVLGTASEEEVIEDYILYSQYLIGCRIRGEYCVYSTVAKDAGLLAWFKKDTAEEAEKWYEEKVEKILDIQGNLLKINTIAEIEVTNNMLLGTWEQAKNFDPFRFEFNTDGKVKYYSKDTRESIYMTTYNIDNNILTINFVNLDESGVTPLSFHVKYSEKEGEKIYIEALDEQANVDKLYGLDKLIVGWYSRVEYKSYSEALNEVIKKYRSISKESTYNDIEKLEINPLMEELLFYDENIYYALHDINLIDGNKEIILAAGEEKQIIDIYTYMYGKMIRLTKNQSFSGQRHSYTIGENNNIYLFDVAGANKGYYFIYEINPNAGGYLSKIKAFELIQNNSETRFYDVTYKEKKEITEEQYLKEILNGWNSGSAFKWIPLNEDIPLA